LARRAPWNSSEIVDERAFVDHYDVGTVIPGVEELNRERIRAARRVARR
jgi:hypothetical protein